MLQTRINTGFLKHFKLFKLFFWFTFSCYFIVIAFQNRIILIRFCILLMWLQSCCTQIVPRIAYKPKLVFTLLNNTPAFIRFLWVTPQSASFRILWINNRKLINRVKYRFFFKRYMYTMCPFIFYSFRQRFCPHAIQFWRCANLRIPWICYYDWQLIIINGLFNFPIKNSSVIICLIRYNQKKILTRW